VKLPPLIVNVGGFKHVNASETYFEGSLTPIHMIVLLILVLLFSPHHLLLELCGLFWT